MANSLRTSVDVSLTPRQAFDTLVDELSLALNDRGMQFTPSLAGKMLEGDVEVGTIQEWIPGERISILWHPKTWQAGTTSRLLIKFKAHNEGTSVVVEHEGWDRVLGDTDQELLGWFAGEVVTPFIASSAPARLGDWITDRRARRPSGAMSRDVYKDPTHHWPNFLAILDLLALSPRDDALEVRCAGGAFLHEARKSGSRAAPIGQSHDMGRLAAEQHQAS